MRKWRGIALVQTALVFTPYQLVSEEVEGPCIGSHCTSLYTLSTCQWGSGRALLWLTLYSYPYLINLSMRKWRGIALIHTVFLFTPYQFVSEEVEGPCIGSHGIPLYTLSTCQWGSGGAYLGSLCIPIHTLSTCQWRSGGALPWLTLYSYPHPINLSARKWRGLPLVHTVFLSTPYQLVSILLTYLTAPYT